VEEGINIHRQGAKVVKSLNKIHEEEGSFTRK